MEPEWIMWSIAGVIAVYILVEWYFRKPEEPADYEKGWEDFNRK